ncbi:hypothetical protein GE061_005723 [Apolygus lucorum]|uniref:lysozyme n=1 Tax=Apolygus lucorum TaxID=248454 RepID=A0A8S9WZQ3_APOLU|nr:hypothetical protein GE061_005723 [Apolygus lucorum]
MSGRSVICALLLPLMVLLVCKIQVGDCKLYSQCELARELFYDHSLPGEQLSTWLCIAKYESTFNSSALGPNGEDFGLFQISRRYWCDPRNTTTKFPSQSRIPNVCKTPCSDFLNDDISDDVACIKMIYQEHQRLQGDGFKAWTVYPRCQRESPLLLNRCFP